MRYIASGVDLRLWNFSITSPRGALSPYSTPLYLLLLVYIFARYLQLQKFKQKLRHHKSYVISSVLYFHEEFCVSLKLKIRN